MPLGQHPDPTHVIAHLSDPHLLAGGAGLHAGRVDVSRRLDEALAQLEASTLRPDAIVFTGDLADLGEADAYARLRAAVEPVASRLGAVVVWVMGNHDEREPYARVLFGEDGGGARPQDRVYDLRGLRIVSLDTSVPGYHHGALDPAQLDWLAGLLATPAEHGTLIAMHHPPMPSPLTEPMAVLELDDQSAFAAVVAGTDVRGVLAGHLHYSAHSTFAGGIPVSVASASCYTLALGRSDVVLGGYDAFQAFGAVHLYPDRVVHTSVPLGDAALVSGYPAGALAAIEAMDPRTRRELLSRKDATGLSAALTAASDDSNGQAVRR